MLALLLALLLPIVTSYIPSGTTHTASAASALRPQPTEATEPGYFVGEYHWTRYYQMYGNGWRYRDCLYRWTGWPFNGGQGDRLILCQPWVYLDGAGYYV